jgi:hypothetical protein
MAKLPRWATPQGLYCALWALELVRVVAPVPPLAWLTAAMLAAYVILIGFGRRRQTRILCAALLGAGFVIAALYDAWGAVITGAEDSTIFVAFFGTAVLLRAVSDGRREIAVARAALLQLPPSSRSGGLVVGAHVMGSILIIGAIAILAAVVSDKASDRERKAAAEASVRGLGLAALWSPFWLAMAVGYQHVPGVPLWQTLLLGLAMAAVGILIAHAMFAWESRLAGLGRAVMSLAPLAPPVAFCAALVVLAATYLPLRSIEALVVVIPAVCCAALLAEGWPRARSAFAATLRGTKDITDEIALLTAALVFGRVVEAALAGGEVSRTLAGLSMPPIAVLAALVGAVALTSLGGLHQIAAVTVAFVLVTPFRQQFADIVVLEAGLVAWALSTIIGVSAVGVTATAAFHRVPRGPMSFGPNLWFAAAFGATAVCFLAALNGLLS